MFEIHPPHSPIHGWRDCFLQLVTITVGLLIALALEGLVEWLHHRHIMHQAQASLYVEIKANAGNLPSVLDGLHAQQKALKRDVSFLKSVIAHPEVPSHESIDVGFSMKTFQNVSWNTAQATAKFCRGSCSWLIPICETWIGFIKSSWLSRWPSSPGKTNGRLLASLTKYSISSNRPNDQPGRA